MQALAPQTVGDPPIIAGDVEAWAARWHLLALRDLAPHLMSYWGRRPAAAARFQFPKIRPIPPPPRLDSAIDLHDFAQPLLAVPEQESLADFVARAKAHYRRRAEGIRQPRQLRRHAEWFVRARVQGWTADQIAEAATTATDAPDVSTIRKGVAEFARLLAGRN